VVCTTVHKVCASGTKATMLGAQSIWLGHNNVVVSGGMESMSNAPHLLHVRNGVRFGPGEMIDHMQHDGLVDAFDKHAMGVCAEITAEKMGFSRAEQDRFALQSFARTKEAVESGRFADEIAPVTVKSKKGDTVFSEDEGFRKLVVERVATLPPAFKKNGTVTAANASSINDGASALVLASRARCEELGLKPLARIIGIGDGAGAPIDYPTAPALAIPKALKMAGLSVKDIDFWEINEAFAVVVLANLRLIGVSESICNVHGGAVALGHPIGSSGSRIIVSLVNILKQKKARYGCVAICNGGGGASSVVIENLQ
jgi:acetyl-CoA C-acetyltransferase